MYKETFTDNEYPKSYYTLSTGSKKDPDPLTVLIQNDDKGCGQFITEFETP